MTEVDEMVDSMLQEGEQAISAMPDHARRIAGLLATHFPAQTLEAVQAAMKPMVEKGPGTNAKVAELNSLLREEAAVAAAQFRAIEMWLRLKTPAVSDGNNFGVEVQQHVYEQIHKMRGGVEQFIVSGRDYHWTRATGIEKMWADAKTSSTQREESTKETTDGKVTDKATKSQTTEVTKVDLTQIADFAEYVVNVDVRQYHQVFDHLTALRNAYLMAHVLFAKNLKKLTDPRGDGEGKSSNVMTMF